MTRSIWFSSLLVILVSQVSQRAGATPKAASPSLASKLDFKIEPVVGYETVYRDSPTPHLSTTSMLGARVSIGPQALSLELQYTKSSDEETYSVAPQTVKYQTDQGQVGLSSAIDVGSILLFGLRAGGQITRNQVTQTSDGVDATSQTQTISPYAGGTFGIHLGQYISLNANSTVIINDINQMSKNDIQNTVSLAIHIH